MREAYWKSCVGIILSGAMLVAHVPRFLIDLYGYAFGSYFVEFLRLGTPAHPVPAYNVLGVLWDDVLVALHADDVRAFFVFGLAIAFAALAAARWAGPLRRVAIASLACEVLMVLFKITNQFFIHVPMGAEYAEIAHAPAWGAFFVLACMFVAVGAAKVLAAFTLEKRGRLSKISVWGAANASAIFCIVLAIAVARFLLLEPNALPLWGGYPPARPKSIEILIEKLALSDGSPFRGRLLTLGTSEWDGNPDWMDLTGWALFGVSYTRYKAPTGNDHFIDPVALSIPTANEYQHWTSPTYFTILRSFFSRPTDSFDKAVIPLRAFDLRVARAIGVRMVVTDQKTLAGGTLIYSSDAGQQTLNIFEIEQSNLGQFSPTQLRRAKGARDALELLRLPEFEPEHTAIIEDEISNDLIAAGRVQIKTIRGPRLLIEAESSGRSLLILPFEYSHCLTLQTTNATARLYPVNLLQVGLLFEGKLNATIEYRYGLFENNTCRRTDIERADKLGLRDVFSTK